VKWDAFMIKAWEWCDVSTLLVWSHRRMSPNPSIRDQISVMTLKNSEAKDNRYQKVATT
jgi:hypothetical protein